MPPVVVCSSTREEVGVCGVVVGGTGEDSTLRREETKSGSCKEGIESSVGVDSISNGIGVMGPCSINLDPSSIGEEKATLLSWEEGCTSKKW